MDNRSPGNIVTFYSYKGGTGRTMALANIACLLGRDGAASGENQPVRIVALDWDFEAPGLHRYFRPYLSKEAESRFDEALGCLDLFEMFDARRDDYNPKNLAANREQALKTLESLDFDNYLLSTNIPGLAIMKAGRFNADYTRRVGEFQWDRLFRATLGLFQGLTDFLRQRYEYVLVDSRTGMSDTSGICTMLLPDKLVVVFTPNQQSLTGIGELTRKAVTYRKSSPDARPLTVFPLPSRLEMARPQLLDTWRLGSKENINPDMPSDLLGYQPLFERLFDEVYVRNGTRLTDYFDTVMLQHIPDYAYGEPIAVMLEGALSRISLRSSYSAFKERLTELRAPWESLSEVRLEKDIRMRCEEAISKANIGDYDGALRLAYNLFERRPPIALFETVSKAILEVARVAYPHMRERVSDALRQASDLANNQSDIDSTLLAGILIDTGVICIEAGDYQLAKASLEKGLRRYIAALGEDHPATLSAGNMLTQCLLNLSQLENARPLAEKMMNVSVKILGETHAVTLVAMLNQAQCYHDMGRYGEAETLLYRALSVAEKSYGPDHADVVIYLNNLAMLLQETNRLTDAEPLMRRVLAIDEKVYGPGHPNVARDLNNLATLLHETNRLTEAESLMLRALSIAEQSYGSDHPHVASGLNNLAQLLKATHRLAEAEPLMRRALSIDETVYGSDHPNVARNLNNLAQLLKITNRHIEAEPLMRRALSIVETSYGPEHPKTAGCLSNLAQLLKTTNRLAEAEPLMRRALSIDEKSCGLDHPSVARDLNNLATLLQKTNRLIEAEPLMRRALSIVEKSYGSEHPKVAISLSNLAQLLKATNRLDEAEQLMRRVVAIDEQAYGIDHPKVARDLNNLAALLQATNRLDEAEPLMRRALSIDEKCYGSDHPNVVAFLSSLAQLLHNKGNLLEARSLQEKVFETNRRTLGERHASTIRALSQLMLSVKQLGDMETFAELGQLLASSMQTLSEEKLEAPPANEPGREC